MASRARAVPVRLTIKRRRKLEQIVRAGSSPQRLVLRARIVLAAAGGTANAAIARDLSCSAAVVRIWRGRFAVRGIPGLFDKPRSGRPETHGPSARLAVLAVATAVPPDGESAWSQRGIAGHLRDRGLPISAATVGRVLAEARVRPHRVRGWLNRADDPSFWIRAGQVCRLYLNPPPGTVLVSIDEKTGIQAKSRKHPQIPCRPGRDARREFEYVRHGTISVIAAMNVTTGEVIAGRIDRNDSATFIQFLAMLHQVIPPHLRIHLIMDNGSSRTSAATRAWLAAHPRFAVTYTPKHASWLNNDRAVVRGAHPQAAAPRRLQLPRRPRGQDHRIHHPAQQERPPLQVELRRRRRARPLPRTPPPPRTRTSPPRSRMIATPGNHDPVRNLRCTALAVVFNC
jgi:transposase